MPSVLSKPAVPTGTPAVKRRKFSDNGNFKTVDELLQYMLVCIIILVKFPKSSEFMQSYLISPKMLLNAHMRKSTNSGVPSIEAFFKKTVTPVTSVMIVDLFKSKVEELFKADSSKKFGFTFNSVDLCFELKPEFFSFFEEIAGEMLNPESGKTSKSAQMMRRITKDQKGSIKVLPGIKEATIDEIQSHNDAFSKILEEQAMNHRENFNEIVGFLPPSRSRVKIFAQNAVIFYDQLQSVHKPSVPAPVPVSQQVTSNLADHPVNDTTELVSAVVNDLFNQAITNVIDKSAEAIGAGNQAALSHIFGEDSDVNALKDEVARQAITSFFAALEVANLVDKAASAGEPVFLDLEPSSPVTIEYDSDNEPNELSVSFLPDLRQLEPKLCANRVSGPLSVIPEEQSGTSSPLLDGERRAPFTTFTLSPQQGVEDRAPGAQQTLFSFPDLSRSVDGSKSSSPQSSFTHVAVTSADGSNLAQSSGNPLGTAPKPPLKNPLVIEKMKGGVAQSSGNPPVIEHSNVGVSGNPRADQPSFPPQDDIGGPPVQVLAPSGNPPGNSSGDDHSKTSKLRAQGSSCIHGRKTRSSTPRQTPLLSGWRKFFRWGRNRVNPSQGKTDDIPLLVAHSSDNQSEFAATTTTLLPSSSSPLGGNIGGNPGAQIQADRLVNVPPSAPSSSSELGSAAATAANPLNEKPPTLWGVDIGGTKRNGVRPLFEEIEFSVLMMKYSKEQPPPPLLCTHPCLPGVPNLVRQARVA